MNGPHWDSEQRRPLLLWFGAAGVAIATLAGMFGAHAGSLWRAPAVLEERVETALLAAGLGGLQIDMSGQRARLSGVVETEPDIARAQRVALAAAGPGGGWAGGVTSVDVSDVEVGRFERPYAWSVRRESARVVLAGAVPSEASRAALMSAAERAFPTGNVADEMRVAGGAPSPRFTDIAREMIRAAARLRAGEARIADAQIVFIGDADQANFNAIERDFAAPPAPFRARLAVTIDGLDVAHPELQGLNLNSGDAQTCAAAFARLLERNVINFNTGSADIDPSSRQLLDAVASVALRCDRFSIEVAGHTDNEGSRELNYELSLRRAEAVSSYLAGQGVARGRLSARGYGADRPRVSNATPAGQAANRRIEFNVSGEPSGATP